MLTVMPMAIPGSTLVEAYLIHQIDEKLEAIAGAFPGLFKRPHASTRVRVPMRTSGGGVS